MAGTGEANIGATLHGSGIIRVRGFTLEDAVRKFGTYRAAFRRSGTCAQAGFHLAADGHGGTTIGYG